MRPVLPDWVVDSLQMDADHLVAGGWILSLSDRPAISITANGVEANVTVLTARPDVADAWAAVSAFATPLAFHAMAPLSGKTGTVSLVLSENGVAQANQPWVFPIEEHFPLPDAQRRLRVCGTDQQQPFQRNGRTNFQRIFDTVAKYKAPSRHRVLDWGSGAGAVARYALLEERWDYTGVDIDADNIEWCKDNLNSTKFQTVELQPPLPFEENSFDVCFGISVVTHLNESNQLAWLAELSRVLRSDSVCLLSVLGVQALAKTPGLLERMPEGFMFFPDDHEIGQLVGESAYYGTTYHTEEYVRRRWSKWFHIVDYLPAALGHQDLVVLRPRLG